jgi:hypothetical protein
MGTGAGAEAHHSHAPARRRLKSGGTPRMVGNSLQDAANSLLRLINSLFGAN